MRPMALRALGAAGVLVCACAASGYEFRVRWVQRIGNTDVVLENNILKTGPAAAVRVRLQFGVFDDESGPAAAAGYVGWNVGTLVDSQPTLGVNTRTPGRLTPFNFFLARSANGTPFGDPWMSLTTIDNTLGMEISVWNGVPGTSEPGPREPATIYGRNSYVSTYEITTIAGNVPTYTITAAGNLVAGTEWVSAPPTIIPDPGDDGIFGPGDFNNDGIDDALDDFPGISALLPLTFPPRAFQSVLTVVVPGPGAGVVVMLAGWMVGRRGRGWAGAR